MRKYVFFAGMFSIALTFVLTAVGCDNLLGIPEECTVTFDAGEGGAVDPISKKVKSGDPVGQLPTPAKADNTFEGWYTAQNGGGAKFTEATVITANITAYAKWTPPGNGDNDNDDNDNNGDNNNNDDDNNDGDYPYTDITIPDEHDDTLAAALNWISGNAVDGGAYAITVKADETSGPRWLSYDGKRVSITLKGETAERKVTLSDNGSLFTVENGVMLNVENLTLKGRGNNSDAANNSALVQVHSGGVLKLKTGAVITENYNPDNGGGGVFVNVNAAFSMEGGTISGNTANGGGGVVAEGTFTMKGGAISGNTAHSGGGVWMWVDGTFTMEDGEISGNTADGGGGVDVHSNDAVFTMKGGTIGGNMANNGGGVAGGGTFTMEGGTISANTAIEGGGVVISGTFTMKGGTISGNIATEHGGGGVDVYQGTFTMENGEISGNEARYGGGVSPRENAVFTMKGGTISGNMARESGGGVSPGGSTFTMEGGAISGNTAIEGGGVYVNWENATFTMENGEISGNTAYSGGGVALRENAVFTKTGGTIYGDTDTTHTPGSIENTALYGYGHAVAAGNKESPEQAPGYLRFLLEIFAYVGEQIPRTPSFPPQGAGY